MIKLYGHPFSRAHRVMWMLKELDLPFEHIETDFRSGATRTDEFRAINPNGRVPVLVDGALTLFESLAINLYLARQYPSAVSPRTVAEEAQAVQWSFWTVTEVEKPLLFAAANLFLFPDHERSEQAAGIGIKKLDRPFRVLDAHLAKRSYVLGDRFSVADVNIAGPMTLIPISGVPLGAYPALSDWLSRCLERPAAADWKPIRFTIPRPPTSDKMLEMFL